MIAEKPPSWLVRPPSVRSRKLAEAAMQLGLVLAEATDAGRARDRDGELAEMFADAAEQVYVELEREQAEQD